MAENRRLYTIKDINTSRIGRKMRHREKVINTGQTKTYIRYPDPGGNKGGSRTKRENGTTEAQKKGNLRRATMWLTWLLNENFQDGDTFLTLKYKKGEKPDYDRMKKDARNFLDKLNRRFMKKYGRRVKYVHVMEIGKKGLRHHHFVISAVEARMVLECWKFGGIQLEPLYTDGNYRKLAVYLVKAANATQENTQRIMKQLWNPSKGLKKPRVPRGHYISRRRAMEIFIPEGYYLDEESVHRGMSEYTGFETLSYVVVKLDRAEKRAGRVRGA